MSSDPPSGGPSATPEQRQGESPRSEEAEPGRAAVVAALGATLLEALEEHLPGARRHAEATAEYALTAAEGLGLRRDRAELVREAARLHDVGMIYVPADVLRKPREQLADAERALLGSHIEYGSRLALGAGIPEDVCTWILHSRERWDGGGPANLAGTAIPLESRILRVACATDLMLSGAPPAATVAGLRAAGGSQLDLRVVEVLARKLTYERRVGST
ncbi:MAG TPA: HD domain-containing phosphohydrolase [Solirubrobacterales bacterium]|nr:HD domain-containing phosphohydrolase [Solirubrobacterales bacterium]